MEEEKPYWQRRRLAKLANNLSDKLKKEAKKKKRDDFYEKMSTMNPGQCQECGASIAYQILHPRENMAHLLPKEHFHTIENNPLNIWWACLKCHTDYDKWCSENDIRVTVMKIYPMIKQRINKLYDKLNREERRRIPKYLQP